MTLSLLLVLTACSEYGINNEPGTHELTDLDGLAEADGELDPEANGELDIPGVDIAIDESDDQVPGIPGVDITTDEVDHDDPPGIPGVEISHEESHEPGIPSIPGVSIEEEWVFEEPLDEYREDDCDGGVFVDFDPGEIAVLSWNNTQAFGEINVPTDGVYEIWNTSISESGASQRNESGFVLVPNALNPSGEPLFANCDGVRILQDADNNGALPAGTTRYVGTFPLEAGINVVEFHHYCPLFRNGQCDQFHDASDAGKTCDSDNVNSVHFYPEQLCLYPL